MEKHEVLMQKAKMILKEADHMISVTYPLLKDPKLIAAVIDKLNTSLNNTVDAILNYEYIYKRIKDVPDDFKEKLAVLKEQVLKTYHLDRSIITLLNEVKEIVEFRKVSPAEFRRKEQFVVCSSGYSTKTINIKKIKEYIQDTKKFVAKAEGILNGV